ncbi:MAG: WD40 repeat domain-containing protein [Pseudanabaena sp.]
MTSAHTDCVHSIAISPNGKILISSSYDKSIRLWRLPDGKHINTIDMSKYCHNGKGTQPKPIQISPDSSHAFFNSINFLSCT